MNRSPLFLSLVCILLLFASCHARPAEEGNDAIQVSPAISGLSPISCRSLPESFHYDNYTVVDRTVFLQGSGDTGPSFFCIDLDANEKTEIALPVPGAVMDLSPSGGGSCLACVYSSRLDGSLTARGYFTLFEIGPDAAAVRQVELTGIDRINLLAIGSPTVNGCAWIGERILIIVNNRVILLDEAGELLDCLVWDSGHPRMACSSSKGVYVYDASSDGVTVKLLTVSENDALSVSDLTLPGSAVGVIPSCGGTELYIADEKMVYSYDIETARQKAVWVFPYGFSKEKEYRFDGRSTLLECYHGRIGFFGLT